MDMIDEPVFDMTKLATPKSASAKNAKPVKPVRSREILRGREVDIMAELDRLHEMATRDLEGGPQQFPFVPETAQFQRIIETLVAAGNPAEKEWQSRVDTRGMRIAESRAVNLVAAQFRSAENPELKVPEIAEILQKMQPAKPGHAASAPVAPARVTPASGAATLSASDDVAPTVLPAPKADAQTRPASGGEVSPVPETPTPAPVGKDAEDTAVADISALTAAPAPEQVATSAKDLEELHSKLPVGLSEAAQNYAGMTESQKLVLEKFEEIHGYTSGEITCGDDDPGIKLPLDRRGKPETHEQRLERLGIPRRPQLWPVMMQWPPARDLDLLDDPRVRKEHVQKYLAMLGEQQKTMLARAEVIHDYIMEHSSSSYLNGYLQGGLREKIRTDPYFGIGWAQLLHDNESLKRTSKMVANWSHHRAMTMDGGIVLHKGNGFRFGRYDGMFKGPSEQSIKLAMQEGIARGWKTFKCRGDREFMMLAEKCARELNIHADIRGFNPLGKKIMVMPLPPGATPDDKGEPRNPQAEASENTGLPEADATARKLKGEGNSRNPENDGVVSRKNSSKSMDPFTSNDKGVIPEMEIPRNDVFQ